MAAGKIPLTDQTAGWFDLPSVPAIDPATRVDPGADRLGQPMKQLAPRWSRSFFAGFFCVCVLCVAARGVAADDASPVAPFATPRHLANDGSHFQSAQGSPVLWLADTWWFCPSALCPIYGSSNPAIPSMFKALVDRRAEQGFNVVQIAFQGPVEPGLGGIGTLYTKPMAQHLRERIWQNTRHYVRYANSRGLSVAIAAAFHTGFDALSLDQHKLLWKDIVEQLAEFDVIWMIAGEYNLMPAADRLQKVDALANYIRSIDNHGRLLTAHPADWARQLPTLESARWMDFIMVQAGHGELPPADVYRPRQRGGASVPVVESECRYEGIHGRFRASHVRQCMIRAIQAGAIGFSYGAHGLWYPTQSTTDSQFAEYGVARPWWEALQYPGADATAKVRRFFERQRWWTMPARPGALVTGEQTPEELRPLVRIQTDERALAWFPAGLGASVPYSLMGLRPGALYQAHWVAGELNPEDNSREIAPIAAEERFTRLPARPAGGDWFLLLQRLVPAVDSDRS